MAEWLSAYLRFNGELYGPACDAVAKHAIESCVQSTPVRHLWKRYFFIRYGESGPHVRLRLLPRSRAAARELKSVVESSSVAERLSWVPYEPETDRYGGPEALPIAESIFHASSALAHHTISSLAGGDRGQRLGAAAVATLVAVNAFSDGAEHARALMLRLQQGLLSLEFGGPGAAGQLQTAVRATVDRQTEALRRQFAPVWPIVQEGSGLPAEYRAYARAMRRARRQLEPLVPEGRLSVYGRVAQSWPEAAAGLLPSFLHMHNNRLGVSIPEEALLAAALTEVLSVS